MKPEFFLPDPALPLAEQREETLLAMLIWGEARGESLIGKIAIANVVRHRVERREQAWGEIILAPKQFSCFNVNDPNFPKLMKPLDYSTDTVWHECIGVAWLMIYLPNLLPDYSKGADHYASVYITIPNWAKDMKQTAEIGKHMFWDSTKTGEPV